MLVVYSLTVPTLHNQRVRRRGHVLGDLALVAGGGGGAPHPGARAVAQDVARATAGSRTPDLRPARLAAVLAGDSDERARWWDHSAF